MGTLGRAIYTVGSWIRGTGQAIDRLGSRFHGGYYIEEQLSRHRTLLNIFDKAPVLDKDVFVAPSAAVIGDVQIGKGSSIWYGSVLRGDVNRIRVGSGTNIQDNSLVHVAKSNLSGKVLPTIIGDNVTVGHSAVLHGCTVEDEAFVGMGAILLDGVVVEKNAMVAAGALVRQNTNLRCSTPTHRQQKVNMFSFVIEQGFLNRRSLQTTVPPPLLITPWPVTPRNSIRTGVVKSTAKSPHKLLGSQPVD